MPAILPNYDPNSKDVTKLGDDERKRRIKYIDARWEYYNGEHAKPLKIATSQRDDNVILNLCARAVDKTVEFIGVPSLLEIPGERETEPVAQDMLGTVTTDAQGALEMMYDNHADLIPEIVLSGEITGHVFLRIFIDIEGNPALNLLDPHYMTVFWDVRNPRQKLFYRQEWKHGVMHRRQDIVPNWLLRELDAPDPNIIGWQIFEYEKTRDGWQQTANDAWDYPFSPVVEFPIKRLPHHYYGISALHMPELNDSVNFIASNTARIIKYHAHPRTIGVGVDPEQVNTTSIDGLFTVPEGANVFNLEMRGDLASSMQMLERLKAEFFAQMRVVDVATIKDRLGTVTNFGVRMIFSDMLEMTDEKRKRYGNGIAEAFRRLLVLAGYDVPVAPVCKWDDPLPMNRLELLQAAAIEAQLGTTSKQSLAESIARDFATEMERLQEERATTADVMAGMMDSLGSMGAFGGG